MLKMIDDLHAPSRLLALTYSVDVAEQIERALDKSVVYAEVKMRINGTTIESYLEPFRRISYCWIWTLASKLPSWNCESL